MQFVCVSRWTPSRGLRFNSLLPGDLKYVLLHVYLHDITAYHFKVWTNCVPLLDLDTADA